MNTRLINFEKSQLLGLKNLNKIAEQANKLEDE